MSGFAITGGKGFHITFPNGVTVSVQFGGGSYSDNYDMEIGSEPGRYRVESSTAEVALWKGVGRQSQWITREYACDDDSDDDSDVLGRQTPSEVLAILNWAAAYVEVPA